MRKIEMPSFLHEDDYHNIMYFLNAREGPIKQGTSVKGKQSSLDCCCSFPALYILYTNIQTL